MPTILIVDDDPNNQRMLSYTLRKAGYEVRVAANGQLGLDTLHEFLPDMAILDLAMPVMDGMTLLRHIRADEHLRPVPVIILTASGDDMAHIAVQNAGANGFLTKPTSSRALIEMVQKILQPA